MRLITGEERPKRKVTYKIGEWDRDCLLEMIGVDPFDPRTQTEYHRRQGYNNLTPPFCIRRDVCANLRHFFFDCPSAMSDEDYANIWGEWAQQEEFKQMKIWDNNARQSDKSTGAAGPASYYTSRNLPVHTRARQMLTVNF